MRFNVQRVVKAGLPERAASGYPGRHATFRYLPNFPTTCPFVDGPRPEQRRAFGVAGDVGAVVGASRPVVCEDDG